jgi:hypothetical protein
MTPADFEALRAVTALRDEVRAKRDAILAPHKAELAALAADLKAVEAEEQSIRDRFHEWYATENAARVQLLSAGQEQPKIVVPEGFQLRTTQEITITEPARLPPTALSPDLKKIRALLDLGRVPGVSVTPRYGVAVLGVAGG